MSATTDEHKISVHLTVPIDAAQLNAMKAAVRSQPMFSAKGGDAHDALKSYERFLRERLDGEFAAYRNIVHAQLSKLFEVGER